MIDIQILEKNTGKDKLQAMWLEYHKIIVVDERKIAEWVSSMFHTKSITSASSLFLSIQPLLLYIKELRKYEATQANPFLQHDTSFHGQLLKTIIIQFKSCCVAFLKISFIVCPPPLSLEERGRTCSCKSYFNANLLLVIAVQQLSQPSALQ